MLRFCLKIEQDTDVLINCNQCGGKATITKRQQHSTDVADLYCSCKDSECGHTFVMSLSFKHTLSPSSRDSTKMLMDILRGKSRQEQLALLDKLSTA